MMAEHRESSCTYREYAELGSNRPIATANLGYTLTFTILYWNKNIFESSKMFHNQLHKNWSSFTNANNR